MQPFISTFDRRDPRWYSTYGRHPTHDSEVIYKQDRTPYLGKGTFREHLIANGDGWAHVDAYEHYRDYPVIVEDDDGMVGGKPTLEYRSHPLPRMPHDSTSRSRFYIHPLHSLGKYRNGYMFLKGDGSRGPVSLTSKIVNAVRVSYSFAIGNAKPDLSQCGGTHSLFVEVLSQGGWTRVALNRYKNSFLKNGFHLTKVKKKKKIKKIKKRKSLLLKII